MDSTLGGVANGFCEQEEVGSAGFQPAFDSPDAGWKPAPAPASYRSTLIDATL
jgi:hypothetical protein